MKKKGVRWLVGLLLFSGLTSNGIAATFEYTGTVDVATKIFDVLTPQGTNVSVVYIADAAAIAGGFVGPGDLDSINFSLGGLCASTDFPSDCPLPPRLELPISSIDAALTYVAGIPTGGVLDIHSFPPTTSPLLVTIGFSEGTFLAESPGLGFASGTLTLVPVPAAVWLFASALFGLAVIRRS